MDALWHYIFSMPDLRSRAWLGANFIHVDLVGSHWLLRRGKNLDELWEELDPDLDPDDKIPYWTELWPSSLLLAEFLAARQLEISGQICIDLGCGLGFTALAGQSLGADVVGLDLMPEALEVACSHARLNLAPQPGWLCMDWRQPAVRQGCAWRIWAADVMYEQRFVPALLDFMAYALAADGRVWISEPGRTIFRHFLDEAKIRGWHAKPVLSANVIAVHPQKEKIPAKVWELSRSG